MEPFVELHCRSAFSFLEGASLPEELATFCARMEMPAMALLDRDGVYGAARFHLAAKKLGIRAHIGAEVTLRDGSRLPLLVQNRAGYQNLCRLITATKLRSSKYAKGYSKAASFEELQEHSEGLIALSGGADGPLATALNRPLPCGRGSDSGLDAALETAKRLTHIFGPQNVYAELQRHLNREEEARNQAVIEIARRARLPLLATNNPSYAHPEQRQILDAFTCIRNKVRLHTAGRLLEQNSERYLKAPREMERLFADLPEAIANTGELSSRLEFTLNDLGYQFPQYPLPPGETMISFLRARTREGARKRYGNLSDSSPTRRQIERELDLIAKLDLAGYFLIVWDIVEFCRREGILVQGRGSAANSAVCYSLGITAVDPIAMGLLFERFLSEQRGEWPDIDLDLPSGDQRERVIQYVYQRYGERGAAMTANVITYRGRSAAREIGKVLDFDEDTVGRLAGLVRTWEWNDPKDTPERQFRDAGLDLSQPRIQKFFQLYLAVQDLPRHLGQHSGGLVMCQGRLDSVVPLEPATMPGRVVVQWDKDDCADMGMIKVDLLGLGMMAVLEDSIDLIRDEYGEEVDLAHLPPDDPAVYSALQQADTIGMFQVESRAQMACLPRLWPTKFYDIVVQVGIIRPGPIVGNMVHPYLKRRQGKEEPNCMHPSLEPVLRRTLGVPLFQEQLLRMAMIAAGFTGGEAEELRRAFSHKRSEERMKEIEAKLRHGMDRNGISGKAQDQIVQSICAFALYGFPESHAASFALLAYASAFLKCHYLAAFTAALLNNQPMGFYQPATIVKDAQRHGLQIKPIDVTRSDWLCAVEESGIAIRDSGFGPEIRETHIELRILNSERALRLGLLYVRGLREQTARAIIQERGKRPFSDIEDLTRRVPQMRKDEIERLATVGALNFIGSHGDEGSHGERVSRRGFVIGSQSKSPRRKDHSSWLPNDPQFIHRREALWQAESAARPAGPLLHDAAPTDSSCPLLPMKYGERLDADFKGTGLSLGRHAMALRRAEFDRAGIVRATDLQHMSNGRRVRIAGSVIVRQRPGTAKGFVFLTLEDETGIANAIVTPDLFESCRMTLVNEPFLLIEGTLQNVDNVASVKARNIQPLHMSEPASTSHDFH
ncbi:MAG: error-prone DNA polymerase [Acidobacteria bacterium]|nr:error-prone DNA polymerase [Acidobacteriota bacterium]